jgi:pilus assembly protein CpaE
MAEKIKGVMVGGNHALRDGVMAELSHFVRFSEKFDDCSTAYVGIKNLHPDTVFIDVDTDPKAGLTLAGHLKKTMQDLPVFLVSEKKDPDVILNGLRIGIDDFLLFPDNGRKLSTSVHNALGKAETGGRSGEITAVFSMKGGQGVTSVAINLADHMYSLTKDRVIMMDMNLFMGNTGVFLDLPVTYTPFDMLKDIRRMDENLLFSSLNRHPRGFYILTAPDEISDADQVSGEDITRILNTLRLYLDHIIIDLPHDFSKKSLSAIQAADTLLVLVQQSLPEIKSAQNALNFFKELEYDQHKIKVVLNRRTEKNEFTCDDISYLLNWPVFASVTNDFTALAHAIKKGDTLDAVKPDTPINRDMETLSSLLTGITPAPRTRDHGFRKTLDRFLPAFKRMRPA